jgi:hypothetical protein
VLVLLLHFSLVISRLADQNKVLAQRLGMLQQRVDAQERARLDDEHEPAEGHDAPDRELSRHR